MPANKKCNSGCSDNSLNNGCVKQYAKCISNEDGYISKHSDLYGNECISQHDINEDLYNFWDEVYGQLYFSNTGWCSDVNYVFKDGVLSNKEAVIAQDKAICELFDKIETLEIDILNTSIVGIIDLKCLSVVDDCGNQQIKTVKDLLQALINKECANNG